MILEEVLKKKTWTYKYLSLEEMQEHKEFMSKAGFNIDYSDEENLSTIFSQVIDELKYSDINYIK